MSEPTFFTVIGDYRALIADLAGDADPDLNEAAIQATVTFRPLLESGDVILATNADPRPIGYVAAPIVGKLDTEGRLVLRSTVDAGATHGYPYTPIRLLANSALLELDPSTPLTYQATFSTATYNGRAISINPVIFEAPTSDVVLNLIGVTQAPGATPSGITKIAPTGVRFEGGNLQFSFGAVDIPEALPISEFTGPQGDAATITVGDVTTLGYDQPATVTNTGTTGDAVLDFALPEGEPATVAVGDVNTLLPEDSATVTNTGTERNAVFDFGIPKGDAATITVGDVTAVAPTEPATVTNAGTNYAAVFDFEIPQGAAATIEVGAVTTGLPGDAVTVINSGNANVAVFDFDIPQGAAATIEVGAVTTVAPGTSATVTNAGTTADAVLDFEIPQGDAATVTVGAVTQVAPTEPATVTNTGTSGDAVFDFEIPQGAAATIEVGSVTTGSAGTNASITNIGNAGDAVFDFQIPRGDKGDAATITVGDVTTLEPGQSATVTNSGDTAAAVFDIAIPRGAVGDTGAQGPTGSQGIQGQPGVSLDIEGTVATVSALPSAPPAGTAYVVADVGLLFYFDGTEWSDGVAFVGPQGPVGSQGIQGIQGIQGNVGATGPVGATGTAATIAVGTVNTGAPGSSASVVNSGSSGAAVFDISIPRGDTGATGIPGRAANVRGTVATYSALIAISSPEHGDAYLLGEKLYIYDSVNGWPADGAGVQWVGPQGASGIAGAVGATGASGTPGLDAATGATGASGAIGLTGPAGPQGASGTPGADGAIGLTGSTGPTGPAGSTGPDGAQGASGIPGATGASGLTGATGPAGTTTWSGITDKPAVIAAGVDAAAARNAIDAEYTGNRGVALGYAALDASGLVPSSQLPSFVDDVLEFANLAAFPATGTSGKMFVALDTGKVYRWGGSTYVEISASPGSTDAVPEGASNLYYTVARADGRITDAVGSTVQAYSPTLTTYAGKSAPTGAVVGTTDAQALSNKDLSGAGNTFPTFNQSTTGNAATATKLETARTINGVSFDGTANITVTATPTAAGQVADLSIVAFGANTTRATGLGDFPFGIKLQRAITFTSVTYRVATADASGNLVVELKDNGVTVAGSSATIAAASQVAGGTVTGSWVFAAGDVITVHVTGVGTTPGKGLIADVAGLTT